MNLRFEQENPNRSEGRGMRKP